MENSNLFHDRYFLERLLGRGNFSEVWLAKDVKTNIQVALKIYAPATGLDDHGMNVLSREFAIVVNANQRNLLKPLYYDSFERKPYLVLPYCKNGSILRLVGQFSEEDAWHLIHDVAAGLAFLHSMNPTLIHQDIKPDNIMIGDNGIYMITDFGVSAHAKSTLRKSMSSAFASAGTTAYMAPERYSKDNAPIKANDIWSLGAMTYEMLVGDVPFTSPSGIEGGLLQKQGAEIPDLPGKFSPQLNQIIQMCLNEQPWERPTAEQVEELAQIALDGGNPFPEPDPWYVKYKVPVIIGSCVLAFLLAVTLIVKFAIKTDIIINDKVELVGIAKAADLMKDASTAQEGLKLLNDYVDNGDADATYLLSRLYFKSNSANDFCPDSIREMQKALNIVPDNVKAHKLLQKVLDMDANNYYAMYELGCDYLGGDSRTDAVERNIEEADKYFRNAFTHADENHDVDYMERIQHQIEKYSDNVPQITTTINSN